MNNKLKALCKFRSAITVKEKMADASRRMVRSGSGYRLENLKDIKQTLALYRESIAHTEKAGLLAYSSVYRPSHNAGRHSGYNW